MPSFADTKFQPVKLRDGSSVNVNILINVHHENEPSLIGSSIAMYKERYNSVNLDVPRAVYRRVKDGTLKSVKTPKEFITYRPFSNDELDNQVEYEEDEADHEWLKEYNNRHKKHKISSDKFCQTMDRLEKESTFQPKATEGYVTASSPDDVCCVCRDGDDDNANQIIYCDMCNIAVHQECYGVPYIPEGPWLCRRCKLSPSKSVACELCPNIDGALKQTSDGKWAHVICAIWLNEVHFGNSVFLEPVEGVHNSLEIRSKLRCMICRKKMGACIQCSQRSCVRAFHVTCAQASGMHMHVVASDDSDCSEKVDVQRFVYCHLHDPDDNEEDRTVRKKKMEDKCKQAYRMLKKRKNQMAPINMPVISEELVSSIAERLDMVEGMRDMLEYWYLKRKARCGVPLIRRLQAEIQAKPTCSQPAFPEDEETRKCLMEFMTRRNQLEKVRMLSELVKKRELNKRNHLERSMEIFEKVFKPVELIFFDILDELRAKDRKQVFAHPVTNVDGYRSIITRPMDLATMRTRCDQGKYHSISDLKKDFDLMLDNCDEFNATAPYYLQYGKRMRRKGKLIFEKFERRIRDAESLLQSQDNILNQVAEMMFYDGMSGNERLKENAPIEQSSLVPPIEIPESESPPSGNIFLRTPKNSFPVFSNITRSKRKADNLPSTPVSKKTKKKENEAVVKQASITRFLASTPVSQPETRRSSLRHAAQSNVPFGVFRDHSIQSPLPADVPTSATESSTEEEDTQTHTVTRSSKRKRVEAAKMDSTDTFIHNDIVSVNSTYALGRVIEPTKVRLDPDLPEELVDDCKTAYKEHTDQVCVLLFPDGKKWNWYPTDTLRVVDLERDFASPPAKLIKTFKKAKEFWDKVRSSAISAK